MQLSWTKCQGGVWCKLNFVNLDHEHFNNRRGVYVIWHGGTEPQVVHIDRGNIKEGIDRNRSDPEIQQYDSLDLYVTWAAVAEAHLNGVVAYLVQTWPPKVRRNHPSDEPIPVNAPWG